MGRGVKIDIDRFVREIAAKLPEEREQVGKEKTYIMGRELKLTGVKEFRGEPIEDDVAYELEVPIFKGKFEPDHTGALRPAIRTTDHEQELRRAYLAKGLPGIYAYLKPYLSEESLQRLKQTFMQAIR